MEKENVVILQEVAPRDGLQNEPKALHYSLRVQLINELSETGLTRIQIGSFVNPKLVPQMADTDKVWQAIEKPPGIRYCVLVLNERGLRQVINLGIPHAEIYVSASEAHSRSNTNMTIEEALTKALGMMELARENGVSVTAGVMCAFGCFHEREVPVEKVLEIINAMEKQHPAEIGIADTAGMGNPEAVFSLVKIVGEMIGPDRLAMHLHDTKDLGMDNLEAALKAGVRRFDTSIGGLGGCPFLPGAKGNISTEWTVERLSCLGFDSNVDQEKLRHVSNHFLSICSGQCVSEQVIKSP